MDRPPDELTEVRLAHRRLEELTAGLTDADAREPSLLERWSRGHLLTHLARNAEGHARIFAAAESGEVVRQYPGGREQRAADIEAGAGRPAAELRADLAATSAALEAAWDASEWVGSGITSGGEVVLVALPMMRWREVCVHAVDLDVGYGWDDLPPAYVRRDLREMTMLWAARQPMGLTGLPVDALAERPTRRLAWLHGRIEIPGLPAAGVWS